MNRQLWKMSESVTLDTISRSKVVGCSHFYLIASNKWVERARHWTIQQVLQFQNTVFFKVWSVMSGVYSFDIRNTQMLSVCYDPETLKQLWLCRGRSTLFSTRWWEQNSRLSVLHNFIVFRDIWRLKSRLEKKVACILWVSTHSEGRLGRKDLIVFGTVVVVF